MTVPFAYRWKGWPSWLHRFLMIPFRPLAKILGFQLGQISYCSTASGKVQNFKELHQHNQHSSTEEEESSSVQSLEDQQEKIAEVNERQMMAAQVSQMQQEGRGNGQLVEEYEQLIEAANERIEQLEAENREKQRTIDQQHQQLARDYGQQQENSDQQHSLSEDQSEQLKAEIAKLEQKLLSSNEEKEYYKKHFRGENQNGGDHAHNGRPSYADDFGKELMMANKRKYQLESRTRQLETELSEAQQRVAHLGENVKSAEKLLWLEKERSATLEWEREQLGAEIGELRRHNDALKRELEMLRGEGGGGPVPGTEQLEELNRLRADCDQRVAEHREAKAKLDWRLGEMTQMYHDTKWRLGEVEATLAHRDWELEQASSRVKQLEASLIDDSAAKVRDEANKLREELAQMAEQKGSAEWRLGEVTQWWNDAKWRLGELEAENAHRSDLLDKAHHRIGELERLLAGNASFVDLSAERMKLQSRASALEKAHNDAQWRVGELDAELDRTRREKQQLERGLEELREQKNKAEWRLGEVTQWWNDAKWRISELETSGLGSAALGNDHLKALLREGGGTFLIRKQPHVDRHKWRLLTPEHLAQSAPRRTWFEAESGGATDVYLIGSFTNWECALRCEPVPERPGRMGIWVDLPTGRHQFRFLRDGQWHTAETYADCWTEHGTKNNWIDVE